MSLKNNILSEIKSIAQDMLSAKQLDPTVLVLTSAVEAAKSDQSFKDRVIHNATEGFQALTRLGEKFSRATGNRLFQLWTKPIQQPAIIVDSPASPEAIQEIYNAQTGKE